ncbi:TniB family NTP-binding protein [Pseudomonas wadenswilerensis]|uniref:AAA+ ATPase domain-containing protein n=1 Tax=Pseudomonas wadenswilerensis TaxID=1785161 RepID=A0A380T1U5_9PSED|nr:TniB family NTP-binding protein [Pseudomonas wadenswilerensis]SUQ64197.1 hypothetical protein CCOS864_03652 [Pseudomonas wadenswilerensis]
MNSDTEERLRLYNQQVVFYHNYRNSYALTLKAIEATHLRGVPNCALITGPSGTGKSTLLNYIKFAHPAERYIQSELDKRWIIPVIMCSLPPACTVKALLKTILVGMHCEKLKGDTMDLLFRLITLLRISEVKVVLIDDFQFLIKKDAYRTKEAVINCLVMLLDQTAIPFILVGRDEDDIHSLYYKSCETLIYQRADLARRFPFHAKLDLLSYSNAPESEFQIVLSELDAKMYKIGDLKSGIHLGDPGISDRIYLASSGSLEHIKIITFHALQICLKKNKCGLTKDSLAQAYALLKIKNNLNSDHNPFMISQQHCESLITRL